MTSTVGHNVSTDVTLEFLRAFVATVITNIIIEVGVNSFSRKKGFQFSVFTHKILFQREKKDPDVCKNNHTCSMDRPDVFTHDDVIADVALFAIYLILKLSLFAL
jgi:hypothetical protein